LKVWAKEGISFMCFIKLYTERIEHIIGHLLHISRIHARQVQKSLEKLLFLILSTVLDEHVQYSLLHFIYV